MKATRSSIVIGLVLALLVPGSAVGQEPADDDAASAAADDCLTWTKHNAKWLGTKTAAPRGVTTTPSGGIAIVGLDTSPVTAMAWVSEDGAGWGAIRLPGGKNAEVNDAALVGDEVIAVGHKIEVTGKRPVVDGAVWRSPDGRSWTKPLALPKSVIVGVVETADGPVLFGESQSNRKGGIPTVWTEADGQWVPTTVGERGPRIGRLVVAPDGTWWLSASEVRPDTSATHMWRTEDGMTWEEVVLPDDLRQAPLSWPYAASTYGPAGLLVGSTGPMGGAVWLTSDGTEWQRVADSSAAVTHLTQGPCGSMAFTWGPAAPEDGEPLVLMSETGEQWASVPEDAFLGAEATDAVMAPDGRVFAVGREGRKGLVWVGEPDTAEGGVAG